ncbi:MAG: biotin--[acetyl-CoA-carboxylase] ligase [Candidatus Edwardsbacteria bacterium]|jgi:BirA family biotin operon repressor/biotin-[acetyl-CoA-carboxylase] ligase|nr:biotin--[acetyl-CoA-carboxylase] ligase [Candidatus Edwardsbacteria bacterium]
MRYLQIDYVRENLHTAIIGRKLTYFERLDSTSARLKAMAADGAAEGSVVIAEQQTAGHGRQGSSWYSPPGTGLYCSLLLRPQLPLIRLSGLTLALGHAAATAIEAAAGVAVAVKWPNDLFCNGRKCGGILTEISAAKSDVAYAAVGIGINVNNDFLPLELCESATSLALESGSSVFREGLLVGLLAAIERDYLEFARGGLESLLAPLQARSYLAGKRVTVAGDDGASSSGVVTGYDGQGALLLINEKGETMRVTSGSVLEAGA